MNTPRRYALFIAPCLALTALALHLSTNHRYGFHNDELYFIACGNHPAFGYVDHPPMVPWIARLSVEMFGDSSRGLRLLSALAHAATILLAARLAKEMGGRATAQALAALGALFAPVYLRAGNVLAIPSFEPVYWALATLLVIRIINGASPRWWLLVGVVAGLGLLNKHTMLFWGAGLTVGLLLTPHRRLLRSPWPYAGALVAALIFLPNLIWQMQNDWASLRFILQLNQNTMSRISALEFSAGQVLYLNPFALPLWLSGLAFGFTAAGRQWRVFSLMYLSLFLFLIIAKSKIYYLAPVYPALFAMGGIAWEVWLAAGWKLWLRRGLVTAIAAGGALLLPLSLPLLDIRSVDAYAGAIAGGLAEDAHEITGDLHAQVGLKELVVPVGETFQSLPPEERDKVTLFCSTYGIAGAMDLWGGQYGLPPARCTLLSYHTWGPGDRCCDTVLAITPDTRGLEKMYDSVVELRSIETPYRTPSMQHLKVVLCKGPRQDLREMWPRLFRY